MGWDVKVTGGRSGAVPWRRALLWAPVALALAWLPVGERLPLPLAGTLMMVLTVATLVGSARAARLAPPRSRVRYGWGLVCGAGLINLLVTIAYAVAVQRTGMVYAVPVWVFGLRLLLAPTLLAAVLIFPARPRNRADRLVLLLDLTMVNGAAALAAWYFIIGPLSHRGVSAGVLLPVAIAAGDALALCGAAFVLLRGVHRQVQTPVRLLMAGTLALALPDLLIAAQAASGRLGDWPGQTAVVLVGMYLWAVACWWRPAGAAGDPSDDGLAAAEPPPAVESAFPYLSVLFGCALLMVAAGRSPLYPWGGLTVGMILMVGALTVRQLLSLQEGRRRAVVDQVTRLANRAGLMAGLERVHARAARGGKHAAVLLLDLDGFKGINDRYGHEIGDQALIVFGGVLRACVLGGDLVGRLGGDEFVIVLDRLGRPEDAVAVADRILSALELPQQVGGMLLPLRTSIGITAVGDDRDTPKASLARADHAMYAAKRRSGSRWVRHEELVDAGDGPAPA